MGSNSKHSHSQVNGTCELRSVYTVQKLFVRIRNRFLVGRGGEWISQCFLRFGLVKFPFLHFKNALEVLHFTANISKPFNEKQIYFSGFRNRYCHGIRKEGRARYCRLHIKRRNFEYTNVDCWPLETIET